MTVSQKAYTQSCYPKCAKDTKQKKRGRIDCVLNGTQNSVVYGAAAHASGGLHVASKGGPDTATTNSLGGPLVLP